MTEPHTTSPNTGRAVSRGQRSSAAPASTTTFLDLPGTFVKAPSSDRCDQDERDFLDLMYRNELFGAFVTACEVRMREEGFTRAELGRRMDKAKAQISRLLANPSNMTARTVAEFANAVNADISFCLVDRKDRDRVFTGGGVERLSAYHAKNAQAISVTISASGLEPVASRFYDAVGSVTASVVAAAPVTMIELYTHLPYAQANVLSGGKRDRTKSPASATSNVKHRGLSEPGT